MHKPPISINDSVLLSELDQETLEALMAKAKEKYVLGNHRQAISPMKNASGYKHNKWRTHYYDNGKRKDIVRATREEIIDELYAFYKKKEKRTLRKVFEEMAEDEIALNGLTYNTISDLRYKLNALGSLADQDICAITMSDIKRCISAFADTKPKKDYLKRVLQLIKRIFNYAIQQEYCLINPAIAISATPYYKKCNCQRTSDDDKAFSEAEVLAIQKDILSSKRMTACALAELLASETGMRAAELFGLQKSDVNMEQEYLHSHHQYVKRKNADGSEHYELLNYTKDQRLNPKDGRLIPLTDLAMEAVKRALELPGDSTFLFHDKAGKPIKKDAYYNNLKRRCRRLNIPVTRNHAFRVAVNSDMNRKGLSPSDRALILGHSVETNERNYSVTDSRRFLVVADIFKGKP